MEHDANLKEVMDDHEKRISRLESLLIRPKTSPPSSARPKLPAHIIALRDKGFFSQPKTAVETHAKLEKTYHCDPNRVAMALLRLSQRRELRRAFKVIDEKRYQAYVW